VQLLDLAELPDRFRKALKRYRAGLDVNLARLL
jgi:hypothetical protein